MHNSRGHVISCLICVVCDVRSLGCDSWAIEFSNINFSCQLLGLFGSEQHGHVMRRSKSWTFSKNDCYNCQLNNIMNNVVCVPLPVRRCPLNRLFSWMKMFLFFSPIRFESKWFCDLCYFRFVSVHFTFSL